METTTPPVPRGTLTGPADLGRALAERGIVLEPERLERLGAFHRLLADWNQRMNLVSAALLAGAIWEELYFDSLTPLAESGLAAAGARLVDVGSGAGFPGLVLALARPDLAITLVESSQKRGKFLQAAVAQLAPGHVTVVNMDVHEYAAHAGARRFDLVTFKAFAAAAACVEIGRKLAKPGGTLLLYKGADITDEINEAKNGFPTGIYRVVPYRLPLSGKERNLIVVNIKK